MQFGSATPFLIVSDLHVSLKFYTQQVGLALRYAEPEPSPFFAIVGKDSLQLMLKEVGEGLAGQPNVQRHPDALWDVFVYVDDPMALYKVIPGGEKPSRRDDGLYGFSISDPDGYVLYFGHPIAQ